MEHESVIIFDLMLKGKTVASVFVTDRLIMLQNFYLSHNSLQLMPRLTIPQYSFFSLQWDRSWDIISAILQISV